jgi:hypothetical protein
MAERVSLPPQKERRCPTEVDPQSGELPLSSSLIGSATVARSETQERRSKMSSKGNIVMHCGGHAANFEQVCAVEVPAQTESYRPVPHGDLVRLLREEVTTRIGLAPPKENYGLNREGRQLFGTLVYDLSGADDVVMLEAFGYGEAEGKRIAKQYGYTIAFRNSYDKSMGLGIVGGVTTFVCDNLALHGSDFNIKLPHTKNVWERAVPEVMVKVKESIGQFEHTVQFLERMKNISLDKDRCYELIGLAQGRGVLTATQAGVAFAEYRDMRRSWDLSYSTATSERQEHAFGKYGNSAYGLYQNFTQALKLGKDVSRRIDKYTGASRLFEEIVLN